MKSKILKTRFTLLLALISTSIFGQDYTPKSDGEVINHTYYTLSYDETHEQAEWVYYELTLSDINGTVSRTDDFRPDPHVSTQSAQLSDYKGSGYDRGHLYPAGSSKESRKAMSESFYMSNMSPQSPGFNRGIWRSLESTVRGWTADKGKLYVVTGPVFRNNLGRIGASNVTIPGYYYKVIYSPSDEKMLGILLPNRKGERALDKYVVPVDKIETLTGIDFFWQLEDGKEKSLESGVVLTGWDFDSSFKPSSSGSKQSTAVQCKGIAKSTGQRCKKMTTNKNEYCHYHQDQLDKKYKHKKSTTTEPGRCAATTQAGNRCKRNASAGSRYCWQHK